MNARAAHTLAQNHVNADIVVHETGARECAFGFYFPTGANQHQQSGQSEGLLVGSCGVIVDRLSGAAHELGSAYDVDYWLKAYDRQLHLRQTVTVTKVLDRQRAADALCGLQMCYVIPEYAHGETWRIPRPYNSDDFRVAFDDLPARFENQNLIFRLHDIEVLESGSDVEITLAPTEGARPIAHP